MKLRRAIAPLFVTLALTPWVVAQNNTSQRQTILSGGKPWTGSNRMAQSGRTLSPSFSSSVATRENQQVKYKVVQIGVLPGKTNSFLPDLKSINNLGHAAGYSFTYKPGDFNNLFRTGQAFIWQDGKLKALPLLPGWAGAFGFALNDLDQVVGVASNVDADQTVHQTPVLWNRGQPINLGSLFPGQNSYASGINFWGVVVGGSALPDNSGNNAPWVWYGGALHALPFLSGMNHGFAEAINDFGVIAGRQGSIDDSSGVPCLWYWNGIGYTPVSLGSFGGDFGDAVGINNLGHTTGWSLLSGDIHGPAFISDFRGLHALPQLPSDTDGGGNQISDTDEITGWSQLFDDQGNFISQRVVIWQNGKVTELNTLVPPNIPTFEDIGNANILGQISASAGLLSDGTETTYILTPIIH